MMNKLKKDFLKEYADLVDKYGLAWCYDSGFGTPDELFQVDFDDEDTKEWLSDLYNGEITQLTLSHYSEPLL